MVKYFTWETIKSYWKTGDAAKGNGYEVEANVNWGGYGENKYEYLRP